MKKPLHFKDEGLILKKSSLRERDRSVVIFTRNHGKKTLIAFGVRSLTSKRISHLETGAVVRFSWREDKNFLILEETELLFAHSRIKESGDLLDAMYAVLYLIYRLMPDSEPDEAVYKLTLQCLKDIYKGDATHETLQKFMKRLLIKSGFVTEEDAQKVSFSPVQFMENLIGMSLERYSL